VGKTQVIIVAVAVLVLARTGRSDDQQPAVQPPAPPPAPAPAATDPVTKQIDAMQKQIDTLTKKLDNAHNGGGGDPNNPNGGARGRRWGGGGGPPPDNGNGGAGGPGAGGPGGPGGFGAIARNLGRQLFGPMMNQMAGVDLENPKAAGREDKLPLGGEKQFVLNVPVGGVEQIGVQNNGAWKVEELFKLTDEQTKAVDALRTEYAAEKKKLEEEILTQQLALADKAKQLRLTYEQRANDVLTGADKDAKQKIDTVVVPSPAVSEVLEATSLTSCAAMFS